MNLVDILLLVALAALGWLGSTQHFIKQLSVAIGVITGLALGIVIYSKLSFLAAESVGRTAILGLITVAAAFICYDAFHTAGSYIERRFWPHRKVRMTVPERLASSVATVFVGFVMIWVGAVVLEKSSIDSVQSQIQTSWVVSSVQDAAPVPSVLQQTASLLNPFSSPKTFTSSEPTFNSTGVSVSQDFSSLDSAVSAASASVFKVRSWGCNATTSGSGFVASDHTIVTNAHVIAGATRISVQDKNSGQNYIAQVILFDPDTDLAVLRTAAQLSSKILSFNSQDVSSGTIGSVLGYPDGGSFNDGDAVVLQTVRAKGYDIYNKKEVTRSVYALRASVVPGDSGGPLVGTNGNVLGLVFGHSTTQSHTGYALTASQIAPSVEQAISKNTVVSSGACAM